MISLNDIYKEWVASWDDPAASAARDRWDDYWNREILRFPVPREGAD